MNCCSILRARRREDCLVTLARTDILVPSALPVDIGGGCS